MFRFIKRVFFTAMHSLVLHIKCRLIVLAALQWKTKTVEQDQK